MRTRFAFLLALTIPLLTATPAVAGSPEFPGTISVVNPELSAGQCQPDGELLAQATIYVGWEGADVPVAISATLAVDGGAAEDVSSSFDPNPVIRQGAELQTTATGEATVPGVATATVWQITATPEGYAPVQLEKVNESRNPVGFCAHLLDCHPSYEGACLPADAASVGDVDCTAGPDVDPANEDTTNGPEYLDEPVTVVGVDQYQLDLDGDGIGCTAATVPGGTGAASPVRAQPGFTG